MNNTRRELKLSHKVLISVLAVIFSLVMILTTISAPTVQISSNVSPQAAESTGSYIPNPTMNANITWSTFYNGWNPLEYSNGTTNLTLNAQESTFYQNPISVNPLDIQSPKLFNTSKTDFANLSKWDIPAGSTFGSSLTQHIGSIATINGHKAVVLQTNATSTGATSWRPYFSLPFADYPSNNIAYDYLTVIANISSSFTTSGQSLYIGVENQTYTNIAGSSSIDVAGNHMNTSGTTIIYPGNLIEFSTPLSALKGLNWNSSYSDGLTVQFYVSIPQVQTSTFETVTIDSIQMTENPLYIGIAQVNGSQQALEDFTGNAQLTIFNPDFSWTTVNNNGYSVAVSQTLQDTTESQSAIFSSNYIEQATYQGMFSLPTAPDLSYAAPNITMPITLSGSQFEVANLNGASFLTTLQTKDNGTFSFGTVNPNNQNTLILEVEYTASQWNASTSAPSFWSVQGLEYYWWMGVIGLLSFIGLASLASLHWGGTEENLKIPKGKFGR